MVTTHAPAPSRLCRLATLFAAVCTAAALSGCDGPRHAPPPLAVTVTGTDASGPLARGQDAVFTFVVTNTSSSDVPAVQLRTDSVEIGVTSVHPLSFKSATCVAQKATCPTVSSIGLADPFTLPAGAVLTFTVTSVVNFDYDGTVDQEFDVYSVKRSGDASVRTHAVLADAREGYYELFATSGLRTNLDVRFKPGATKFAVSSGAAESTFVEHHSGFVFASGLVFDAGPDILVGRADFGHGPETFIGARVLVDTLADLDGTAFTLMGIATPNGGAAASTVRTLAIAGSTMTSCADTTAHAIASCPAGSLRHYALTQDATIFTATDGADNDSFNFQVARSAGHLILLQADKAATGGVFAVGLAEGAIVPGEWVGYGTVGGVHAAIDLKPGSFALWLVDIEANVTSTGATAALAAVAGGPAGLVAGVRPSDNAPLLLLQQPGLVLVSGPAGEFDALIGALL